MSSIGTKPPNFTMQRRSRIFSGILRRKAPNRFGGFFFSLETGMESELSHQLPLGQRNNSY
jgi:hypothetical protein